MIFASVEYNIMDGEHYLKLLSGNNFISIRMMESPTVNLIYPAGRIDDEDIHVLISYLKEYVMPLVKGKKASSKKGFSENVKREMKEGKKQDQAVAIAYSEARGGKKGKKK